MSEEHRPLIASGQHVSPARREKWHVRQERVGKVLESRPTALDATFVLIDLGYDALHPKCQGDIDIPGGGEEPEWLERLGWASFGITSLFLVEVPLEVFAFGLGWFWSARHAFFHALDATVIIVTFVLELFLRGAESEVASLLIIIRLWRLVKLSSGVAVGVTEAESDGGGEEGEGESEVGRLKVRIGELEREVEVLRKGYTILT